jgi:hypothetical protein
MPSLRNLVVAIVLLVSSVAQAQVLAGRTFQIGDNGVATFGANGDYTFVRHGKWVLDGNRVCITFDNGQLLCSQLAWQGNNPTTFTQQDGKTVVMREVAR